MDKLEKIKDVLKVEDLSPMAKRFVESAMSNIEVEIKEIEQSLLNAKIRQARVDGLFAAMHKTSLEWMDCSRRCIKHRESGWIVRGDA